MKRVLSLLLVCVLLVCLLPLNVLAESAQTTPMYRLYNPNSGEHFYTGSVEEKDNLVSVGWNYEGIAWNAPIKGGDPVYRLYNPNSGDHHYTMSALEREMLVGFGWKYEGVCWNSVSPLDPSAVPLFRLYNPNADCGSHHYTTSAEERNNLVAVGWILEGIGWFGAGDHVHKFKDATCTEPKTCKICGATEGAALGHSFKDATCTDAKICKICGTKEGNALGHDYQNGVCTRCDEKDPDYVVEDYVWIPTKGGTKYHASAECSNMEEPQKVTKDEAKALGFTACKKCYGNVEETFAPIAGTWKINGLTDDGSELDKISVMFNGDTVEFWAVYFGRIPDEYLESALEFGYAFTDEGTVYYNDILEYEGNYYYWIGGGGQTSGTYTEEGNLIVLNLDAWDEETGETTTCVVTLVRTSETTCEVQSIDGIIIDSIVTECVKNGKVMTFTYLEAEEE